MAQAVDLSQLSKDEQDAVDKLTERVYEEELTDNKYGDDTPQYGEGDEPTGVPVTTAFLVVILPNGQTQALADVNTDIVVERWATPQDMKRASQDVVDSVRAQETAVAVHQTMMQQMQAMQQAQAQAELAKNLGDLRGGLR